MNIRDLVRPELEGLIKYEPGEDRDDHIKLSSNENPRPPHPHIVEAVTRALETANRYPVSGTPRLTEVLARRHGLTVDDIMVGNGSNEIIGLLVAAFVQPGEEVITSHPTFLMYQKFVQIQGGTNKVVELQEMQHDLEGIRAAVTDKTRLIFLDIPNNPTGTVVDKETFDTFLKQLPEHVIVALDEAYVDFVDPEVRIDAQSYIKQQKPVVALRTFSKAYGLSGLRLGYGLMPAEIANYLDRVRQPFNVNSLAQTGGVAALQDDEYYQLTLQRTRQGIFWLSQEVAKLGCRPLPTHTNFFLIDIGGEAKKLYEHMLHKGVIVRPMQAYGYPNFIRITVGQEHENQRFVKALAESLQELGYGS